ncbi:YopX protein [uncultured Caudovirales phage]|uniref:YopX protein n=1 Tax=uncultured Caudovirales phage TaxID=2100421 RepID=A0A6J5LBB8_9CAUD|nr:YopX protein [uncultured Caudovirales phage]
MRKIIFKAKRVDNGEWVEVFLLKDKHLGYYITEGLWASGIEVIPETVGQFTGLTDKNGKMIFEGDIINHEEHKGYLLPNFKAEVLWIEEYSCFGYKRLDIPKWNYPTYFTEHDELKTDFLNYVTLIGNIHN